MLVTLLHTDLDSPGKAVRNTRTDCGMRSVARWYFAVLPLLSVLSGCGGETRVPVFPVSGKVTFEGTSPVGAQVVLHAVNNSEASDVAPTGVVQNDGSFTITAYDPGDGAPQGQYVATIQWFKITPEAGGPGPNVVPPKYASAKTSPIKVTVNGGPTQIEPIRIARK